MSQIWLKRSDESKDALTGVHIDAPKVARKHGSIGSTCALLLHKAQPGFDTDPPAPLVEPMKDADVVRIKLEARPTLVHAEGTLRIDVTSRERCLSLGASHPGRYFPAVLVEEELERHIE
jgi:hypothetical protein